MTSTPEQTDLQDCADEPIRVPGAIQPHGWLVVGDLQSRRAVAYSRNWDVLAEAAGDATGAPALLDATLAAVFDRAGGVIEPTPTPCGVIEIGGRRLDATVHRLGERLYVELEPTTAGSGTWAPLYSLAQRVGVDLQRAATIGDLGRVAVEEMKRLSGFGRCLLYRFGDDGHGRVLEEALDPGYDAYLGHHFPASDIPAQARELYRLNHIRLIPDANYTPVPLVAAGGAEPPNAIDLTFAALRSVSPVHLEYMRNMGTLASMSVSIVVRGRLWGLISCHNHEPRGLPYETRAACEHLGQLLSMQIDAKQDNVVAARQLDRRRVTLDLVARLHESDATLRSIVDNPLLLELVHAAGAAVVLDEQVWTAGQAPAPEIVATLVRWVESSGQDVVCTDRIGGVLPEAAIDAAAVAGVLVMSLSNVHRHHLLWFRPEYIHTIDWAGDPHESFEEGGRIHPRRSFATWREEVRGHSRAWDPSEIGAAAELRQALLGIVLKRAQERAMLANELTRANAELEAFSYTVSHDLRAPMRHIAGFVDLVLHSEESVLDERARHYLTQVKEASAFAGQLVDALLDFSRLGRSALKPGWVNVELLVDDMVREITLVERARAIEWHIERPLPALWGDPVLLKVVVRNLVGNAVKYTRDRTPAVIRISGVRSAQGAGLQVTDNGVGFSMKYASKLFGVFQRLHHAEEFEGTGIGLANVRRIVERHAGAVGANAEPGRGAAFTFTLPLPAPGTAAPAPAL